MSDAQSLESKFEELKQCLSHSKKHQNIKLVEDAFRLAEKAHKHQKRASKEGYIIHPLSTALILSEYYVDDTTIAASLLHDVVEDTNICEGAIEKAFGKEIAEIVDGVTKIDSIPRSEKLKWEKANFEKFFKASSQNMRVLLVKLADKIHNLSTLKYLPKEKQKRIAREALELYSPLAENLGIKKMRYELEALAFPFAFPEKFREFKKKLDPLRKKKRKNLEIASALLKKELEKTIPSFEILSEDIEYYSVLMKLISRKKTINELYDYSYIKVLTESEAECYAALGIIHRLFSPVPTKMKDYIALPLNLTYKSIHTTVVGPDGKRIKFVIRSREMDRLANQGVIYFINDEKKVKEFIKDKFELIRSGKINDSEDGFVSIIKMHVLDDDMLVFDKNGKKYSVPRNSTILDFAYALGSRIGNHCSKAFVNEKEVPLWTELDRGDRIEIKTSISKKTAKPWIEYVKTLNARNHIKKALAIRSVAGNSEIQQAEIFVNAKDKIGLLAELTKIISSKGINISQGNMSYDGKNKNIARIQFTVDVNSKKEFEKIVTAIKGHGSVIQAGKK